MVASLFRVEKGGSGGRRGFDGVISGRAWMEEVGDEGRKEAWPHTVVLGGDGVGERKRAPVGTGARFGFEIVTGFGQFSLTAGAETGGRGLPL